MNRIIRRDFNATRTAIQVREGNGNMTGTVVHSSRTGLTGTVEFLTRPGDRVVEAFREDAIPIPLPGEFFVFSGHGSRPENLQRYPISEVSSLNPPWWAYVQPADVGGIYAVQIARAIWREESQGSIGPKRHGVVIAVDKIFDELKKLPARAPFVRISRFWVGMPPKRESDTVGLLINRVGGWVHIPDWDQASAWLEKRAGDDWSVRDVVLNEWLRFEGPFRFSPDYIGTIGCQNIYEIQGNSSNEPWSLWTERTGRIFDGSDCPAGKGHEQAISYLTNGECTLEGDIPCLEFHPPTV